MVQSAGGGGDGGGCRCLGPAQVGSGHRPTPAPCHTSCDTQTETMVWTFYLGIASQNTKHTGLASHLVSYTLTWKRLTFPGSHPALPGTAGREGSATRGQGPGCGARRSGSSPGSNSSAIELPRPPLTSVPLFPCLKGGKNKPWLLWTVTEPPDWQQHFSDAETDQAQSQAPRDPHQGYNDAPALCLGPRSQWKECVLGRNRTSGLKPAPGHVCWRVWRLVPETIYPLVSSSV